MNKILQSMSSGDVSVTNDGATILKAIQLDNAAAKILVNISKVQDDEVGDGTTSVTVLAAELLREAEKLIGIKIHPQTIVEGYRIASAAALKALEDAAVDNGYVACAPRSLILCVTHSGLILSRSDAATFRGDLMNIARTTLSSKVLSQDKDYFANLAVDAVLRLKVRSPSGWGMARRSLLIPLQGSTDLDHIQIIKKVGGKLTDSYLDEG
jgi:T-complex protein 1 subunit beta